MGNPRERTDRGPTGPRPSRKAARPTRRRSPRPGPSPTHAAPGAPTRRCAAGRGLACRRACRLCWPPRARRLTKLARVCTEVKIVLSISWLLMTMPYSCSRPTTSSSASTESRPSPRRTGRVVGDLFRRQTFEPQALDNQSFQVLLQLHVIGHCQPTLVAGALAPTGTARCTRREQKTTTAGFARRTTAASSRQHRQDRLEQTELRRRTQKQIAKRRVVKPDRKPAEILYRLDHAAARTRRNARRLQIARPQARAYRVGGLDAGLHGQQDACRKNGVEKRARIADEHEPIARLAAVQIRIVRLETALWSPAGPRASSRTTFGVLRDTVSSVRPASDAPRRDTSPAASRRRRS